MLRLFDFFVAHEYAHILAGHVDKESECIQLEYSESQDDTDEGNLFTQMKEFQVDQMAVQFLCYMSHWNFTTEKRLEADRVRDEFIKKNRLLPMPVLLSAAKRIWENKIRDQEHDFASKLFTELSFITAGVNVVFYTFDYNRKSFMEAYAKKKGLSEEVKDSFIYKSGFLTLREFDHPLPAIRMDAVTRIIDECIEHFVSPEDADDWCFQVSRYSWEVEIVRNDFDLGKLYRHIAYTPIAQDFIQEMEELWEAKKDSFKSYVKPLVRLFYANRIVHMTNDGELIDKSDE